MVSSKFLGGLLFLLRILLRLEVHVHVAFGGDPAARVAGALHRAGAPDLSGGREGESAHMKASLPLPSLCFTERLGLGF